MLKKCNDFDKLNYQYSNKKAPDLLKGFFLFLLELLLRLFPNIIAWIKVG